VFHSPSDVPGPASGPLLAHVEKLRQPLELGLIREKLAVGLWTVPVELSQELKAEDARRCPVAHRVFDNHGTSSLGVTVRCIDFCV